MNRSQKREAAFLLIYQSEFNDDSFDEIVQANIAEFDLTAKPDEAADLIETAKAVAANAENADKIIAKYSATRKVSRIPKVSIAVMRLALYEMDCLDKDDVPDKVAINEAIELCKKYADESDWKFVSGLLGNYYREKVEKSGDVDGSDQTNGTD